MTTPDDWLQSPDNLLVGSPYRLVVLPSGMEPILSEWITIGEKLHALLAALQRPLRLISGRVVDREGKPLANIKIFQSGDRPKRTILSGSRPGRSAPRLMARSRRRITSWSGRLIVS
jgi:hypothetical protein